MCRLLVLLLAGTWLVTAQPPDGCDRTMDLVFLVDSSESIREDNPFDRSFDCWTMLKWFLSNVTDNFRGSIKETKIGVVKFSSNAETEFDLQTHVETDKMIQDIRNMAFLGENTNLARGLDRAYWNLKYGSSERKVLVVLTDALVNVERNRTYQIAQRLKNDSVLVISVGLTEEHDLDLLRSIATTWDNYLQADGFQGLRHLVKPLVHLICGEDPIICKEGEYFDGFKCKECGRKVDLALLVDDSGSIREKNEVNGTDNYEFVKIFLKNLVSRLPEDKNRVRLAILRFSGRDPKTEFRLDNTLTRAMQRDSIQKMEYASGGTFTGTTLNKMRTEIFNRSHGDRPAVPNVAVLITDGESEESKKTYTIKQAELAKNEGVRFFTVGITNKINETELNLIASSPKDEHFYKATEFRQLNGLVSSIIKQLCRTSLSRARRSAGYYFGDTNHDRFLPAKTRFHHSHIRDSRAV